jgi:hypothetical protein
MNESALFSDLLNGNFPEYAWLSRRGSVQRWLRYADGGGLEPARPDPQGVVLAQRGPRGSARGVQGCAYLPGRCPVQMCTGQYEVEPQG